MGAIWTRFKGSAAAFAAVWRNPNLRWLELAWTASIVGQYAFLVAVSVYAYGVGGEGAVGLVFLARLIPAALLAPFAGLLGDRYPRERVLLVTNVVRILLVGAGAIAVFADADPWVVYGFAIAATIATTPFRSSQAAITPNLARTPEELTAANAVASGVESVAVFAGPALAGVLFAVASTGLVFTITALLVVVSALFLLLIRLEHVDAPRRELEASTIMAERLAGFTTLGKDRPLRLMMVLLTAQTAVFGAVQVFIVIGALSLTGARRLSPAFLSGTVLIGVSLMAMGIWQQLPVAIVALALMGIGSSLVDVAGLTLVQRAVPDDVLARVFGVIQMLWLASIGIGAAVVPVLIAWLGVEASFVTVGALLPVLVILLGAQVARIDAQAAAPEAEELRILASVPIFAPLPGGSLEHVAARLVPLRLEPGTVIVREGDAGDRFYIVADGEVEVTQSGAPLTVLAAGGYFGEIALLRDVARTATVTARTSVVLYALDRDDFLAAVTGHPQSAEAAETVMAARLAGHASTGYRSTAT